MPKNKFSGTFITQIKYSISLEVGEQAKLLPDLSFANSLCTGKSFSEVLILASTNPQYDKRFFIELRVQYMKITNSKHVLYINCFFVFVRNMF